MRRERSTAPIKPKPRIINAHTAGSGALLAKLEIVTFPKPINCIFVIKSAVAPVPASIKSRSVDGPVLVKPKLLGSYKIPLGWAAE